MLLSLKQKVHSVHIMVSCFDGIRIEKPITQAVHLLQSFVGVFVFWFNENQDQYKCLLLQHIIWTKHHNVEVLEICILSWAQPGVGCEC